MDKRIDSHMVKYPYEPISLPVSPLIPALWGPSQICQTCNLKNITLWLQPFKKIHKKNIRSILKTLIKMQDGDESDLSPYERLRLQRIKENAAMMASLGLGPLAPKLQPPVSPGKRARQEAAMAAKQAAAKRRREKQAPTAPSRRSSRVKAMGSHPGSAEDLTGEVSDGEDKEAEEDDDTTKVDYEQFPIEAEQLDDDEFQVYTLLRKWRFLRHRELEVEAYKIFPNRVFCEAVRRRRNDSTWAMASTNKGDSNQSDNDDGDGDDRKVSAALLECWGIGAAKAAPGGFGFELNAVLSGDEACQHFTASRRRSVKLE